MKEKKSNYEIDFMCRMLEVSSSGYYDHCNREPSLRRKDEAGLATKIKEIHKSSRKVYGSLILKCPFYRGKSDIHIQVDKFFLIIVLPH